MPAHGDPDPDAMLIERELRAAGSPSRAVREQRYLKSSLEFTGTAVPATRAIISRWRRAGQLAAVRRVRRRHARRAGVLHRKAIGWVLRETAKKHPDLVADWLAPRLDRASGVTVREAVRWLPAASRDALLTQRASGRAGERASGRDRSRPRYP